MDAYTCRNGLRDALAGAWMIPEKPSCRLPGSMSLMVSACQEWASRKAYARAIGTKIASAEMMREVTRALGAAIICRDSRSLQRSKAKGQGIQHAFCEPPVMKTLTSFSGLQQAHIEPLPAPSSMRNTSKRLQLLLR